MLPRATCFGRTPALFPEGSTEYFVRRLSLGCVWCVRRTALHGPPSRTGSASIEGPSRRHFSLSGRYVLDVTALASIDTAIAGMTALKPISYPEFSKNGRSRLAKQGNLSPDPTLNLLPTGIAPFDFSFVKEGRICQGLAPGLRTAHVKNHSKCSMRARARTT